VCGRPHARLSSGGKPEPGESGSHFIAALASYQRALISALIEQAGNSPPFRHTTAYNDRCRASWRAVAESVSAAAPRCQAIALASGLQHQRCATERRRNCRTCLKYTTIIVAVTPLSHTTSAAQSGFTLRQCLERPASHLICPAQLSGERCCQSNNYCMCCLCVCPWPARTRRFKGGKCVARNPA
jgi:hypothetical protein